MAFPNVFTEKVVGLAFAFAFGLWSWMLYNVNQTVLTGLADIKHEQVQLQAQLHELEVSIGLLKLQNREDISVLRERQNNVIDRLNRLERIK